MPPQVRVATVFCSIVYFVLLITLMDYLDNFLNSSIAEF